MTEPAIKLCADSMAGNWKRFPSFAWLRASELEHPERWAILHLYSRDSDTKTRRRGEQVERAMPPFLDSNPPTCYLERHRHWAWGWVQGVSVLVWNEEGRPTPVFRDLCERGLFGPEESL